MSSRVRIGLIGCGGIAERHIRWLLAQPDCEICALCDTSAEAVHQRLALVQEIRPQAEVICEDDYQAVLANPGLDGVVVLLPHHLHYPVAKAALEAGKHVSVEKPLVTKVAHARDLIDTARRVDRRLAIAYQRAYLPVYVHLRQMIEQGDLGTIRFMSAHLEQSWFQPNQPMTAKHIWRRDPDQSGGGQFMDTGSHTIAALLDVSQQTPAEVFAYMDNCGAAVDVNTALVVRFASGALASVSIGGFGHSVTEVLRIVGDKASARIFFRTVREQALEIDGQVIEVANLVSGSNPNVNFIDAILGRASIAATGELGLRVAQLSEAAYQSVSEHCPVQVA